MAVPTVTLDSGSPQTADYTPGSAVTAGDVVVQDDLVCFAQHDIAASALGALAIHGGIWKIPKTTGSGEAIVAGALCYWDAGNTVATTTASTHKKIGHAAEAATDAGTHVYVHLGSRD